MKPLIQSLIRFIDENPMKVYSAISITGDLFYVANFFATGTVIWLLGALCGIVAHSIKISFGRGAIPALQAKDYPINLKAFAAVIKETVIYAAQIFTLSYWRLVGDAVVQGTPGRVFLKIRRTARFWRYPLDAGWILIFIAGLCYFLDGANVLGLREAPSVFQALVGVFVALATALAFVTDRNDLAGRLFAGGTLATLSAGIFELNLPLACAGLVFLYSNYLIGKTKSSAQSDYVIKVQEKAPHEEKI